MITSTSNMRVKYIVQLQKKRKLREEEGVFVVEGTRMFREIPKDKMKEVFVTEDYYNINKDLFVDVKVELVSEEVFTKISETKTPQGVLAIVKYQEYTLNDLMTGDNKFFLIMENVQDPGNVGTIIRTGEAAGVTGIIMNRQCADLYQAKTIRSTMGSILRLKCVVVDDLVEAVTFLKTKNVTTYGTHLKGAQWYNKVEYKNDLAILIGNEGNGLTQELTDAVDTKIKIPMAGEVESLNAAIAASVVMYEVFTQNS